MQLHSYRERYIFWFSLSLSFPSGLSECLSEEALQSSLPSFIYSLLVNVVAVYDS